MIPRLGYPARRVIARNLVTVLDPAARLSRACRRHTTYVGVTGSCGKSSTLAFLSAILARHGRCHGGPSNRNLRLSTEMRLLSAPLGTRFSLHELSGHRPGALDRTLRLVRPKIGIVTNVGEDHWRSFGSKQAIAAEKSKLIAALPRSGTAILNADDPHVMAMAGRSRAPVMTFGVGRAADVSGHELDSTWPDPLSLTIRCGGEARRVKTRFHGIQFAQSALAATAAARGLGIPLEDCLAGLAAAEPPEGRRSIVTTPSGVTFALDVWKAPHWTLDAALEWLGDARAARKIAVFGTITHYEGRSRERHRQLAEAALAVADLVCFVGERADYVESVARRHPERVLRCATAFDLAGALRGRLFAGDLVLVKCSHLDHLERIALDHVGEVRCWRHRCGVSLRLCRECGHFSEPALPNEASA